MKRLAITGAGLVALFAWACARGPGQEAEPGPGAPELMRDLAGHHHPISTKSGRAQRYFDQGLVLTFGFNHDAAVRSFEEAARLDPGCAMCFWGIANALGPNINWPMGPDSGRRAHAAAQEALRLAPGASPREAA